MHLIKKRYPGALVTAHEGGRLCKNQNLIMITQGMEKNAIKERSRLAAVEASGCRFNNTNNFVSTYRHYKIFLGSTQIWPPQPCYLFCTIPPVCALASEGARPHRPRPCPPLYRPYLFFFWAKMISLRRDKWIERLLRTCQVQWGCN